MDRKKDITGVQKATEHLMKIVSINDWIWREIWRDRITCMISKGVSENGQVCL